MLYNIFFISTTEIHLVQRKQANSVGGREATKGRARLWIPRRKGTLSVHTRLENRLYLLNSCSGTLRCTRNGCQVRIIYYVKILF